MIGSQPAIFAAISADNPTAPTPNTAILSPGVRLHDVQHGAGAGLAAAGERAEQFKRRVVAHFDGVALLAQRESAERGLLKERAVNRRAVLRQQGRAVGAGAARLQAAAVHAIVLPLLPAIGAGAAPRIRHDHVVAGRKPAHGAADGMHDAGAFVAVNGRVRAVEIAVAAVQIGLAHAARHDADDHLVRARLAQLHGLDGERARPFADDGGLDLHGGILKRPAPSIPAGFHMRQAPRPWASNRPSAHCASDKRRAPSGSACRPCRRSCRGNSRGR